MSAPFSPEQAKPQPDASRRRHRLAVLGLLAALVSAAACLWLAGLAWPDAADTAVDAPWLQPAPLALALALVGPIALAGWLIANLRRAQALASELQQQALRRRRAQLELLDLLPVAVAICGPGEGRILFNQAMAQLLRVERVDGEALAFDWQALVATEDWPAWVEATAKALRTGRAQWLRCTLCLAGARRQALAQIAPIDGDSGMALAVSLAPQHGEGGLAQETILQLRDLLERAEAEKWHFGQAVHDELGQRLSGIAFFAKALQRKLQSDQRAEADDAGWLTGLTNETMAVARSLARGLVPVGTDDPDALGAALDELCETSAKAFGIECSLDVASGFDPGGAHQANHIFHAVQELITNAFKHGHASRVQVSLAVMAERQQVSVRNDGDRLDPTPIRGGMGVSGVRSRAAYLGGVFSLGNDEQGGVLAMIDLPRRPAPTEGQAHGLPAGGTAAARDLGET